MRKALKKPANNAACTTNQSSLMLEVDKTYENEDSIHFVRAILSHARDR